MALKKIVVQGATLGFKTSVPSVSGAVTFVSLPSTKVGALVSSVFKGAYKGSVQFQVAPGCTDGTCTSTAPYSDTFSPASAKGLVENEAPLREDDEKVCSIPGQTSLGAPCSIAATVVVTDPGQSGTTVE